METATDAASAQGWRRPLLAWLLLRADAADQAGDASSAAALRRRMNGEALPLARKAGRDLAQIIARATQCKPADRYAIMRAFEDGLRGYTYFER